MQLRLSEAIRLAGMQYRRPQTWNTVFEDDEHGTICGACALGGAALVVGIHTGIMPTTAGENTLLAQRWPILLRTHLNAPSVTSDLQKNQNLAWWISVLFECYQWTREAIADWVETIEAQQDQQQQPAAPREPAAVER